METTKEAIAKHQKNIESDKSQIEFYKEELRRAEYGIKLWRVFKMVDELFLWYELKQNLYLYDKQYARLKNIQYKLKEQYKKTNN